MQNVYPTCNNILWPEWAAFQRRPSCRFKQGLFMYLTAFSGSSKPKHTRFLPMARSFNYQKSLPMVLTKALFFNRIILLPPAGRHHLLSFFPFQKSEKETEPEPKNTRQRTILAQIICHYVHLGLCSLDQSWRENIPGSFPFCKSSEGNSLADHSLLSACSKPIISD